MRVFTVLQYSYQFGTLLIKVNQLYNYKTHQKFLVAKVSYNLRKNQSAQELVSFFKRMSLADPYNKYNLGCNKYIYCSNVFSSFRYLVESTVGKSELEIRFSYNTSSLPSSLFHSDISSGSSNFCTWYTDITLNHYALKS